jgi:hypothetical protein
MSNSSQLSLVQIQEFYLQVLGRIEELQQSQDALEKKLDSVLEALRSFVPGIPEGKLRATVLLLPGSSAENFPEDGDTVDPFTTPSRNHSLFLNLVLPTSVGR